MKTMKECGTCHWVRNFPKSDHLTNELLEKHQPLINKFEESFKIVKDVDSEKNPIFYDEETTCDICGRKDYILFLIPEVCSVK